MSDIYQWLYDHYALPQLKGLESAQDNVFEQLAGRLTLSKHEHCRLADTVESFRLQWGTEAFILGLRFGAGLAIPHVLDEDCSWLLNFLP